MTNTFSKSLPDKPSHLLWFQSWLNRKANILAAGYILIFLVTGILTLPNYGLTWDEGLGNLFFSERYLHYFTSFDATHLNFEAELPDNQSHPLNLFNSPYHLEPNQFPPVADMASVVPPAGWLPAEFR